MKEGLKTLLEYFKKLAEDYHVSLDNVLSIALNRYGIILKDTTENRLRFNLQFNEQSSKNYFAVCL